MFSNYCKLLRVQHYIKNALIFTPLFFSQNLLAAPQLFTVLIGFGCFSLAASIVYIINDLRDLKKDRQDKIKRSRPLASGAIVAKDAVITLILLILLLAGGLLWLHNYIHGFALLILLSYIFLNVGYSYGLKNIPIIEIIILASGFIMRVIFGAVIINVEISIWLYLTVTMGAFYLGFGKRRNELKENTRAVLRHYTWNFLDKNMYVCQTLCLVFYSLWSIDPVTISRFNSNAFIYTIPALFLILIKYNLDIETRPDGDPTSIILRDKLLLGLGFAYILVAFCIVYIL
jgi:4-hydroxybenzoate polyprenyltransferase